MKRVLVSLMLAACGGGGEGTMAPIDGPTMSIDARMAMLPMWQLEDVQPQSARFGQTYGVDVFSGSTVVVTLVEGF